MGRGRPPFLGVNVEMPKRLSEERIRALKAGWRMLAMLNATEAAVVLGVSRNTLAAAVKAEHIPYVRLGRHIRFPVDALQDWLKCPDRTERVAVKAAAEMTAKPVQADAVGFTEAEFSGTVAKQKVDQLKAYGFDIDEESVRRVAQAYGADGDELWRLVSDEQTVDGEDA